MGDRYFTKQLPRRTSIALGKFTDTPNRNQRSAIAYSIEKEYPHPGRFL
jgi:hypothetical protein